MMAVNKVTYGGNTLIDLTSGSVTPETLAEGVTAHDASGNLIRGTMVVYKNLTLGVHTDGLLYVFSNGQPIGTGVEMPDKVGDVYGNVDSGNTITLKGYIPNGTYTFKYELDNGTVVSIGSAELDNNVYYAVSKTLTYCTINNSTTKVVEGSSYSATITANDGYELKSVTVTMGGANVSVTNGVINIASVTGNIVISAVAEVKVVTPTYTNLFNPSTALINQRVNSSYALVAADGKVTTGFIDLSGKVPFTSSTKIYIKGATFTKDGNTKIVTYKTTGTAYTGAYSSLIGSAFTATDEGNGVISISGGTNTTTGSPVSSSFISDIKRMCLTLQVSTSQITTADIQNIVITIDEPIV